MTHDPRVTKRMICGHWSYRAECVCGMTSPLARDRATAELAVNRHRWEHKLEETA